MLILGLLACVLVVVLVYGIYNNQSNHNEPSKEYLAALEVMTVDKYLGSYTVDSDYYKAFVFRLSKENSYIRVQCRSKFIDDEYTDYSEPHWREYYKAIIFESPVLTEVTSTKVCKSANDVTSNIVSPHEAYKLYRHAEGIDNIAKQQKKEAKHKQDCSKAKEYLNI